MNKELEERRVQNFLNLLDVSDLPRPVRELKFHSVKGWKFDFAWPDLMIALEVEGGIFIGGRHSGGVGMLQDFSKYNEAAIAGWRIVKVVPKELNTRATLQMLRRILMF